MVRIVFTLWMFASVAVAQVDKGPFEAAFKKEAVSFQAAVDDAVNSVVPGPAAGVTEHAKATFLEGYGVVVSLEASLEPGHTPFSSPKTLAELRTIVVQRRKDVQSKLEALMKDRIAKLSAVGDMESLTIAIHLFSSSPDLQLPKQIVLTVKKQDPATVIVREY